MRKMFLGLKMSGTHDNWERLVAAVIRREELWQLCHQHSRTSSLTSSVSSDFSSNLSVSSFSNADFDYDHNLHSYKHPIALSFQDLVGIKIDPSQEGKVPRLVFFKGSLVEFGLEELLMSNTYVLGEKIDSFNRTFLVRLRNDFEIVVKRFKIGNVKREQLETRIETIGNINNENVVKLWGYCLSENELLCFYEYFPEGSVNGMLHVHGGNWVALDWETRLRTAIDVAKGLAHVHEQCDGKFLHGSIDASNIFIDSQEYRCCLGDPIIVSLQNTGYHSPEVLSRRKAFQASDIYSFGVFLIELVSDISPTLWSSKFKSYVDWARYEFHYEWTILVYDVEILKKLSEKNQMLDMLQIAMCCVKNIPEDRPYMNDVVDMLCHLKLLN